MFSLRDGGVNGQFATHGPIQGLSRFGFTIFDLDQRDSNVDGRECVTLLDGEDKMDVLAAGDDVACADVKDCSDLDCQCSESSAADAAPEFCSATMGGPADNPAYPSDAVTDADVEALALRLEFHNTTEFQVRV